MLVKCSHLFFSLFFFKYVVHTNALLGKVECFCDCSTSFILFSSSSSFSSLFDFVHFFLLLFVCVWVYVLVEGRDSQTLHWWLFSWFIIIKHCNDSFIQLVVTCRSECLCVCSPVPLKMSLNYTVFFSRMDKLPLCASAVRTWKV